MEARGVVDEERVRGSAALQIPEAFALPDNGFDGSTAWNVIAHHFPAFVLCLPLLAPPVNESGKTGEKVLGQGIRSLPGFGPLLALSHIVRYTCLCPFGALVTTCKSASPPRSWPPTSCSYSRTVLVQTETRAGSFPHNSMSLDFASKRISRKSETVAAHSLFALARTAFFHLQPT